MEKCLSFFYTELITKISLYIIWVALMIVVFLPLISTAESGLSVSAGRSERLLWPSCWDLHPWAGHAFPRSAWENQDFWLPKPFHTGRRTQRASQVLPKQIYSGKIEWFSVCFLKIHIWLRIWIWVLYFPHLGLCGCANQWRHAVHWWLHLS